jgi:hypothetical protein
MTKRACRLQAIGAQELRKTAKHKVTALQNKVSRKNLAHNCCSMKDRNLERRASI